MAKTGFVADGNARQHKVAPGLRAVPELRGDGATRGPYAAALALS